MTHIPDLALCDYFGLEHSGHLLAVGWLDRSHDYPTGQMQEADFSHIERLLQNPFQPVTPMGLHTCNLCQFAGPKGLRNIFIPDAGDILVAPELILHYIDCHGYRPPDRFVHAARRIESTRNMKYKKGLLANNGHFLLTSKTAEQGAQPDAFGAG